MTLFKRIASWDNLLAAFQRAARGKRGQPNVAAFEHRLEDELVRLRDELLAGEYRPGPYASFFIHEPKRRLISAAPFRDRVVHHALCLVVEPLFERRFVDSSYANRRSKGNHKALARCQQLCRTHRFVLQCDVRQFFPSIDHRILRDELEATVEDPAVVTLVERVLASGEGVLADEYDMVYFPGDDLFAVDRPRGLPIGNLTSQFWANVYLDPFDHFVTEGLDCESYVRYVDDFLLFGDRKAQLWQWKGDVEARLAELRLTLHPGAQPRPVGEGLPFLGFQVFPWTRRLKRRKAVHFRRRLRKLVGDFKAGELPLEKLTASVQGWIGHARWGDTSGLCRSILRTLPQEAARKLEFT